MLFIFDGYLLGHAFVENSNNVLDDQKPKKKKNESVVKIIFNVFIKYVLK